MSDVERALAFVARREGRQSLSEGQWSNVLSLGLRWMSPAESRAFVSRAVAAKVLVAEAGELRLAFDPRGVEIPSGFRPSVQAAASPPDAFSIRLEEVAKALRISRERLLLEVRARQERAGGLLSAEAALLWYAAESGIDVTAAASEALKRLEATSREPAQAAPPQDARA